MVIPESWHRYLCFCSSIPDGRIHEDAFVGLRHNPNAVKLSKRCIGSVSMITVTSRHVFLSFFWRISVWRSAFYVAFDWVLLSEEIHDFSTRLTDNFPIKKTYYGLTTFSRWRLWGVGQWGSYLWVKEFLALSGSGMCTLVDTDNSVIYCSSFLSTLSSNLSDIFMFIKYSFIYRSNVCVCTVQRLHNLMTKKKIVQAEFRVVQ